MARKVYVWDHDSRKFVERKRASRNEEKNSGIIEDTMPETMNHADGKYYTSKSAFRRATRAAGFFEVGDDPSFTAKPKDYSERKRPMGQDLSEAYEALKASNNNVAQALEKLFKINGG